MQKGKLKKLRKKYPKFIYRSFSYEILKNDLRIFFVFETPPGLKFKPKIIIKNVPTKIKKIGLDNFVFHLGLAEMPSYWKATCSPIIEIQAGYLNKQQLDWWKKLFIKGMGQFFYENKISWRSKKFLTIKAFGPNPTIYNEKLNVTFFLL